VNLRAVLAVALVLCMASAAAAQNSENFFMM
jgi:hypothetical protein